MLYLFYDARKHWYRFYTIWMQVVNNDGIFFFNPIDSEIFIILCILCPNEPWKCLKVDDTVKWPCFEKTAELESYDCGCLAPTKATVHPSFLFTVRVQKRPTVRSLLRVCAWESPVGSGGGAQRDLTTRNLRENRQSWTMCRREGGRGPDRGAHDALPGVQRFTGGLDATVRAANAKRAGWEQAGSNEKVKVRLPGAKQEPPGLCLRQRGRREPPSARRGHPVAGRRRRDPRWRQWACLFPAIESEREGEGRKYRAVPLLLTPKGVLQPWQ